MLVNSVGMWWSSSREISAAKRWPDERWTSGRSPDLQRIVLPRHENHLVHAGRVVVCSSSIDCRMFVRLVQIQHPTSMPRRICQAQPPLACIAALTGRSNASIGQRVDQHVHVISFHAAMDQLAGLDLVMLPGLLPNEMAERNGKHD